MQGEPHVSDIVLRHSACPCRDATDLEVLQLWLDEFLDAECTNEVSEVQEQFAFGISAELTRLRTAEKARRTAPPLKLDLHECVPDQCSMALLMHGSRYMSQRKALLLQVSANTRATAAAVSERTKSAAAVASQQVLLYISCSLPHHGLYDLCSHAI